MMFTAYSRLNSVFALVVAFGGFAAFPDRVASVKTFPFNKDTVAVEGYLYCYPLVTQGITKDQMTNVEKWDGKSWSAPPNTLGHMRGFPPLEDKTGM